MERAEQVDDVVHPLVEVGPVARAAVVAAGGDRLEPRQQRGQLGIRGLTERLRVRVVQVRPERQHAPRQRRAP